MRKEEFKKGEVVIYQSKNGSLEFKGDFKKETIWASQSQIVKLFNIDQSVVSRHIRNIFKDKEISQKSNMQIMHIANSDKPVIFYSLDVILAVGYRTNSKIAINFRKWATKTLKEHLIKGYTLNKKQIAKNYDQFLKSVESVKKLLPNNEAIKTEDVLELIKMFADTWVSLDAYDKSNLPKFGITKRKVKVTANEIINVVLNLKKSLIEKKEATEIFAQERDNGSLSGIIGNIFQSFEGKEIYPSLEEKSAHLLYFIVKNHPFIDGNKRSGAFVFIWFLNKTKILYKDRMSPEALTALTLFIAESNPRDKEKIIGLILQLLK